MSASIIGLQSPLCPSLSPMRITSVPGLNLIGYVFSMFLCTIKSAFKSTSSKTKSLLR